MKEYKILFPTKLNSGEAIDNSIFKQLENKLLDKFNGFSKEQKPIAGYWKEGNKVYKDQNYVYYIAGDIKEIKQVINEFNIHFLQLAYFISLNSNNVIFYNPVRKN